MKGKLSHILFINRLAFQDRRDKYAGFLRYVSETERRWRTQLEREPPSTARLRHILKRKVDGVVVDGDISDAALRLLAAVPVCVSMDTSNLKLLQKSRARIAFAETDPIELGRRAAEYFLSRAGTANFGFIGYENVNWSTKRQAAYRECLTAVNRSPQELTLPFSEEGTAAAHRALHKFLLDLPKPTCVFAACDRLARWIVDVANEAGIAVPNELSVLGVDNEDIVCTHSRPTLSSLQPDFTSLGYEAARLLDTLLTSSTAANECRSISGCRLIERESTAQSYSSSFLVARAKEAIRSWPDREQHVSDIARSLGVSRRLLDLRFREVSGESILDFMRHERIDKAKRLLSETSMPIVMICDACNFRSPNQFKRIFHAETGQSMKDWRRTHAAR